MKIGILTFYDSFENYGQLLQCYSLQEYLKRQGHDPFLIRYNYLDDYKKPLLVKSWYKIFNPFALYRFIKKKMSVNPQREEPLDKKKFNEFRQKYINQTDFIYNTYEELKKSPPEADAYIVGSDQVWNFYGNVNNKINLMNAFFLNFGNEEVIRIAYAASWGRKTISKSEKNLIIPLIGNLDFVSVRENTGVSICNECNCNDAKWVCDPTLLLPVEHYRKLYKNNNGIIPEKNYVFFYYLENGGNFNKASVFSWAKRRNLDVIFVAGEKDSSGYEKKDATVYDWLSLIDNAKYVITNSFHCCLFSVLFEVNFAAIKLDGINQQMNERLYSLFNICQIQPRIIEGEDFRCLEAEVEKMNIKKKYLEWLHDVLKTVDMK